MTRVASTGSSVRSGQSGRGCPRGGPGGMNAAPAMTSRIVLLLVAVGLAGSATEASAQKKKAVKACGITAIPLSVGNQWVYEAVAHPTPLEEAQKKLLPPQPSKVTITVATVETKED